MRTRLLFVLGLPQSGTTLLGRLLNAHSRVLCVGEMTRVADALRKQRPCSCGALLPECTFWSRRLALLEDAATYDYRHFTPTLYEQIRESTGAELLVDLSKSRAWRMARSWRSPWRHAATAYVITQRDGRGILASWLRRGERPLTAHLSHYRKWTRRFFRFADSNPQQTLLIRYEDLCRSPRSTIQQVCAFAGMEFEEGMLEPGDAEHHFIHSSRSALLHGTIRLDERWRVELDSAQQHAIEAVMRRIPGAREMYLSKTQ